MSIRTAECVTPKHPDKQCDIIADTLLDAYLEQDPHARVAVEIMGGHGVIHINGEVGSDAHVDVVSVVQKIVGDTYMITNHIAPQSHEIARGVDTGGAGDQGIMKGYATNETANSMPREYELARSLCRSIYKEFPYDGKTQVSIDGNRVIAVVASFQNAPNTRLRTLIENIIPNADTYHINPAGEWSQGGFDADTGLSGRKLIVDNYGPEVTIGGGSFSGKDATKVDRSGAYIARRIAVDLLSEHGAKEVHTKLAYAIGHPEPVMAVAVIDGKEEHIKGYDLTPQGIREHLELDHVRFTDTAHWGHFGNGFTWG